MSYGRNKLYDKADVAEQNDVAVAPVLHDGNRPRNSREAKRQIDTLRSINAHLVRELESLKRREAQAQRLADRDGLTGLFNRRRMLDFLDTTVADAAVKKLSVGILFVDLDGFKRVNDELGHAAGDKLLMTVASRIAARVRTGDIVCRYGGDEFVVLLPLLPDAAAAFIVADTIRRRVALPYRINGDEVRITTAIGVAVYPEDGRAPAALLQRADEAMYREKSLQADRHDGRMGHPSEPTRRRDDKTGRYSA